jgi:hypothetical protein
MVVEVFLYVDDVVWLESGGNKGRVYSRISRGEKLWKEIFSSYDIFAADYGTYRVIQRRCTTGQSSFRSLPPPTNIELRAREESSATSRRMSMISVLENFNEFQASFPIYIGYVSIPWVQ